MFDIMIGIAVFLILLFIILLRKLANEIGLFDKDSGPNGSDENDIHDWPGHERPSLRGDLDRMSTKEKLDYYDS